jgi:hypothetical protein
MRITTAGVAERRPQRSPLDQPDLLTGSYRRGELAAGLAAVAVVAQCALAPVTLLVAGLLMLTGRISRWPLAWLLLPALGSVSWLAVAGLPATAHALTAGAGRLMAADLAVALHPRLLLHPAAAFAGTGRWLPSELPLLLLAGTAEAAVVLWPHRTQRPGIVAALRRRAAAAALAAGHTVTAGGFAIGVSGSGRLSAVSWAQAERGVLLTGSDPAELDQIGLAIACAAVRRRKGMLVIDLTAAPATREPAGGDARGAGVCTRAGLLAERLGVPVTGTFGGAIRGRSVVLVCEAAESEAAQQALSELAGTLASLRELGLRADCLAWVVGCEAADAGCLSGLLTLGHATGTAVVLSTTSPELAADLAAGAGVVVASGPITGNLAQRLADLAASMGRGLPIDAPLRASIGNSRPLARTLQRQRRGSAVMIAASAPDGPASFLTVPLGVTEVR